MREPAVLPDYHGGCIVNLMASIVRALDGDERLYPPLRDLPSARLTMRNVVLLVIDGLGHEWLLAHRPDGPLGRHVSGRMTSVFPSTTATAITTFLTGTAPQQHGVTGWFTYFAELGTVLAVLPYQPRHGGRSPTIPAGRLLGHRSVFDRVNARSHVVAPDRIVHSEFNAAHNALARPHGYKSLDQMFETLTRLARAAGGRQYVYGYWPELDRLAHAHGIESREALAHLSELDAAFGAFLQGISGTSTIVIVTGDHGFIDASADQTVELDLHPQLARTLSLPLCGDGRVAYCYVQPNRRAQFTDYVATHLDAYVDLRESAALVKSGYFGLGSPHPHLHERVGDFTLLATDHAVIRDWLPGEPRYVHVGVHGGTSAQEMYVPLIVAEG